MMKSGEQQQSGARLAGIAPALEGERLDEGRSSPHQHLRKICRRETIWDHPCTNTMTDKAFEQQLITLERGLCNISETVDQ